MTNGKKKKHSGPKLWRGLVIGRQTKKYFTRKHWTRARWLKFHAERDAKREAPPRTHLMALRMQRLERERDSEARSQRMLAYHARRRAAKTRAAKAGVHD